MSTGVGVEKQKFWGSWVVGVLASVRPRARLSLGLPVPHYHLVQENLRPTPALSIPRHTSFWPPGGMLSSLSVQFPSVAQSCQTATRRTAARQASLSITNSGSLLKLMSFESAIQPSHPLSCPSPPAPNPSQHQGLSQGFCSLHQVAKALELQLQHQSFQ